MKKSLLFLDLADEPRVDFPPLSDRDFLLADPGVVEVPDLLILLEVGSDACLYLYSDDIDTDLLRITMILSNLW